MPRRNGSTGGNDVFSGPEWPGRYGPAPAMIKSRVSVSTTTRVRCCRSAASDCTIEAARDDCVSEKMAAVNARVTVSAAVSSTSEKPASRVATSRPRRDDGHRPRIDAKATRVHDQHAKHERASGSCGHRLDRPATDVRSVRRRRYPAIEGGSCGIDDVAIAVDVARQRAG